MCRHLVHLLDVGSDELLEQLRVSQRLRVDLAADPTRLTNAAALGCPDWRPTSLARVVTRPTGPGPGSSAAVGDGTRFANGPSSPVWG